NGVDAPSVAGLEVARVHAERLREITVAARERIQVAELRSRERPAMQVGVGLAVRDRENLGIRREIVRGHLKVRAFKRLRDSCGPGEHVAERARTRAIANRLGVREDPRHERALRTDVLDHEGTLRDRSSAISSRRRILPDGDFGIFSMNSTDRTFLNDATTPATYSISSSEVTSRRSRSPH